VSEEKEYGRARVPAAMPAGVVLDVGGDRALVRPAARVCARARNDGPGVLDRVARETEIAEGVRVVPAPGHTPAPLVVEVGEAGGLLVDASLGSAPGRATRVGRGLDRDPEAAVATRRELLVPAAERGHELAISHWDAIVRP
jgi:glyoxylase-like metal-dependent hydrolase (beta-lactamase superfamily II)